MDRTTWMRIAGIAEQALALNRGDRNDFVAAQIAANPAIASDIEAVVGYLDDADEFAACLHERVGKVLEGESFIKGRSFGPYEIQKTLGWGGMGAVYLAERADEHFAKTVALKVLPQLEDEGRARDQFIGERQILAGLEHPAIARLLDGGVTDLGQPYFALEYVEGRTSSEFADDDAVSLDDVLEVFAQVCDAVAYAHGRLVVHCDLKPSNVLVDREGRARLIDFGIARIAASGGVPDLPAGYLDTPLTKNYASPELLAGATIDTRADVYSLGNLLFRLATGRQRYSLTGADDPTETIKAALGAALPRTGKLTSRSATVRHELSAIIERATETEPSARYASAAELAADIRRVQNSEPLSPAPSAVALYRLRKLARRNPLAAVLASVASLAVVVTLATLTLALQTTREERRRSDVARQAALESAETSNAVVEFLVSVFNSVDPEGGEANANATARELLESGLRAAEGKAIEDAAVAAKLDLAMGRVGVAIGSFKEAAVALERALASPLEPAEQRVAKLQLALAFGSLGEREREGQLLEEVESLCRPIDDHRCLATVHKTRAMSHVTADENAEAIASFQKALTHLEALEPVDKNVRSSIAMTLFNIGIVMHRGHKYAEAGPVFERAMRIQGEVGGRPSVASVRALGMMGNYKNARGEFAEAKELLEKAREQRIEIHGKQHPEVAFVEFFLSNVYEQLGDFDRALELADSSLASRRLKLGEQNLYTAFSWGRKGEVLGALQRFDEARVALEKARAITLPKRRRSHAKQGFSLANILVKQGAYDDAIAMARDSLAIYASEYGETHLVMARGHISVAKTLDQAGRHGEALAEYQRARVVSTSLRADHVRHPILLFEIGKLHMKLGRKGDAHTALNQADTLAANVSPKNPGLVANIKAELARLAK